MKKIILLSAMSLSSLAYADSGFYTAIKAGISDTHLNNMTEHTSSSSDTHGTFNHADESKAIYPNLSLAAGFDFSKITNINARAELEYTYKDKQKFTPNLIGGTLTSGGVTTEVDGGNEIIINELQSQSLMLNGYYDFKNSSKFIPYLSAGAGVTRVKSTRQIMDDTTSVKDTDNTFTWSVGAGVAYPLNEQVTLDLSYKYVDAGEMKFNNDEWRGASVKTTADLTSHEYSLGIRYSF